MIMLPPSVLRLLAEPTRTRRLYDDTPPAVVRRGRLDLRRRLSQVVDGDDRRVPAVGPCAESEPLGATRR